MNAIQKLSRTVGTHNGTFHADEVTACALLIIYDLVDQAGVHRTRDPDLLARCEFVCDVGGLYQPDQHLFDHHQADYQGELSSAGMILKWLEESKTVDPGEAAYFRNNLVDGVDAHDNGRAQLVKGVSTFSNIISQFAPVSYEASEAEQNKAFEEALRFTIGMLKRMRQRYIYSRSCRSLVAAAMKEGATCLEFNSAIPWLEPFFELGGERHPAQFVLMPKGEHWKLRGVPPTYERRMDVRNPFPESWAGLLDEDLKRVSGIPGAIFCHKGRFISVWETREDALRALRMMTNTSKEKENE